MSHHNLNPSLYNKFLQKYIYTAQIAMSWHKGIYIYYKECVALMYINIILYQIGRRKGIKRRKIKRDKVHGRKSKLEEMKKNH